MVQQVSDVMAGSREIIIDAQHLVAHRDKTIAQMGSQKACAARDQYLGRRWISHR
jgi:hypothetical protein